MDTSLLPLPNSPHRSRTNSSPSEYHPSNQDPKVEPEMALCFKHDRPHGLNLRHN